MGDRLRVDRLADGDDPQAIDKDVANSRARIVAAPAVIAVCFTLADMDRYADARRAEAERLMAVQSTAMAAQNLLLLAHAEGLGACWMCAPLFCPRHREARARAADRMASAGADHARLSRLGRSTSASGADCGDRAVNGRRILALAGGVGGGKLARGLAAVLPPDELTLVVNTADDFVHLGLHICPDIELGALRARRPQRPRARLGSRGRDLEFHGCDGAARRRDVVPPRRSRSGDAHPADPRAERRQIAVGRLRDHGAAARYRPSALCR